MGNAPQFRPFAVSKALHQYDNLTASGVRVTMAVQDRANAFQTVPVTQGFGRVNLLLTIYFSRIESPVYAP